MTTTKQHEVLASNWIDPMPEKAKQYPPILLFIQFLFNTLGRIFPKAAGKIAYYFFTKPRTRAKHKQSDDILESAKIFEFMYGRSILKGYEWGNGDKTILLVHGWESRGTGLRTFVPALLNSGFRVVAFDGPAHGDSSGNRTTLPHFAGAVKAAIKQLGGVYGIITHSFGGASTAFALVHLDNSIRAKKLVFIGVPARLDRIIQKVINTLKLPPKAAQYFIDNVASKLGEVPSEEANIIAIGHKMNVEDILIIHDRKDAAVPFVSAEEMYKYLPNASLLETNGYGHYRLMKNPDLIDRVCWFIHE